MFKIRIEDKRFYRGNRTTACIIDCYFPFNERMDYDNIIMSKLNKYFKGNNMNVNVNGWGVTFTVRACATCSPNDEYDESLGRKIAENRAFTKIYKIGKQICSVMLWEITKQEELVRDSYYKFTDLIESEVENLDDLLY